MTPQQCKIQAMKHMAMDLYMHSYNPKFIYEIPISNVMDYSGGPFGEYIVIRKLSLTGVK